MSNYWKVNLGLCTINAYNKVTKKWQIGIPITAIPSVYAAVVAIIAQDVEVTESNKSTGPYYLPKGPTYTYRLPVLPEPLQETYTFKEGVKTQFHRVRESGDIVMSDYEVAEVIVTRPPFRWPGHYDGYRAFSVKFAEVLGFGNYTQIPDSDPVYKMNYSLNVVSFYYEYFTQDGSNFTFADYVSPSLFSSLHVQHPDAALVTSVTAAANQGYWDALTEFAELPEAMRFIAGSIKSVATLSASLHGKLKSGIRSLKINENLPGRASKELSDYWLQYRYAITPLAYSVSDVRNVMKQWLDRIFRTERAGVSLAIELPTIQNMSSSTPTVDALHRCVIRDRYDAKSFCSKMSALLSVNPFTTAYELTRLSFVLDWFVNIGDYIAASTSVNTYTERVSCYSVKINTAVTYSPTSGDGPIVWVEIRSYKRDVINPSDHIGLTSSVHMNWKRQLDAIALSLKPFTKLIRSLK